MNDPAPGRPRRPLRLGALAAALACAVLAPPDASGMPRAGEPWLAYVSGEPGAARIYVIRADGAGRRRLPSAAREAVAPAWSGDGARLAFVGVSASGAQIFVVGADGAGLRQVTHPPASHGAPAWAPAGAALAFVERRPTDERAVLVAGARGGAPRRLAAGYAPAWSPDGRFVAFLHAQAGVPELYVVAAVGGVPRRVATAVDGHRRAVTGFAWAPDGRHIAYTSRSGPAQEEIRIVELDGGALRWLSTGYAPAWSPDGGHVAFTVSRVGSAYVAVSAAAGGGARPVTERSGISVRPAWSPDGRYLAFVSVREAGAGLYVARPDGTGARRLDAVHTDFGRGPLFAWKPR